MTPGRSLGWRAAHARVAAWSAVGAIVVGTIARFVALSADPQNAPTLFYIIDEGRWAGPARSLALFGRVNLGDQFTLMHILVAPLYQAASTAAFMILGVGLGSARVVPALCGTILLVAVFLTLRRRVEMKDLAIAMVILAVQPDLLVMSRLAVPEVPALLFEFIAFALIVSRPRTTERAFVGGLLLAVAMGFKATGFPLILIFPLVLLAVPDREGARHRRQRVLAFLGGVLGLPLVCAGVAWLLVGTHPGAFHRTIGQILGFLRLNDPYDALASPFYGVLGARMNTLVLVDLVIGALLLPGGLPSGGTAFYLASAVWAGGWMAAGMLLGYFPWRYQMHGIVPLAINLATGLTFLRDVGWQGLEDRFRNATVFRRRLSIALLSLPLAALLASPAVALVHAGGALSLRFRYILPAAVLLEVGITAAALGVGRLGRVAVALIAFPLIVVGLERVHDIVRVAPTGPPAMALGSWASIATSAIVVTVVLCGIGGSRKAPARAGILYGIAVVIAWLATDAPPIMRPTYTMAAASAAITAAAPPGIDVGVVQSATLFLGNRVPYRELSPAMVGDRPRPEVLLFWTPHTPPPEWKSRLDEFYTLAGSFALNYGEASAASHYDPVRLFTLKR